MAQPTNRVLIVEDESDLRRNMVRAIAKLEGIEVHAAESVDAALAIVFSSIVPETRKTTIRGP